MLAVIVFALFTPYSFEVKALIALMSITLLMGGIGSMFSAVFNIYQDMKYISIIQIAERTTFCSFRADLSDRRTWRARRHTCDHHSRFCQPGVEFRTQPTNSLLQAELQTHIRLYFTNAGRFGLALRGCLGQSGNGWTPLCSHC